MTREESIKELQESLDTLREYDIANSSRLRQALKMAIKALSQEPCDDAISRQAVRNIVNDIRDCISVEGYCAILERLKKLPPVTQKSGKWIIRDDLSTVRYYQCSECNEIDLDYSDYCPNCGAKMESEVSNG